MNLHEALDRVADMRARILESQKFRGYSGRARALGGCLALIGALVIGLVPQGVEHVALPLVWGAIFIGAFGLNYGAVLVWWLRLSKEERARSPLGPALENLPVFVVGGALTAHLVVFGFPQSLTGMWAAVFSLTHFTAKYALPRGLRLVGWWYVGAGCALLFFPDVAWEYPVLPGLVFFLGETAGGWLIFKAHHSGNALDFLFGKHPLKTS